MPPSNKPLAVVCLLLFLLAAAFHLLSAAKGHPQYRDQHLGTALLYAQGKIDLLRPVIPGFTATDTPMALEFPIWQGLAGLAMKLLGPWPGWANAVSLLIFATAAWPLYGLARAHGDARRAWWALAFFLAQPLSFFFAGAGQTEGLCLAASVWFLYALDRMLTAGGPGWIALAALTGTLTAVSKLPLFFCTGLAGALLVLMRHRTDWRCWARLAGVGAFSCALFFAWTHHTDGFYREAEFPYVDLRVKGNPEMMFWYFGDLAYRLQPKNWAKGVWHFLNGELGSYALVAILLLGLFTRKNFVALAVLAGGLATTMVFAHLVLHHQHYFILFAVPVAFLCADGATWIEERALVAKWQWPAAAGIFIVLALSCAQGLVNGNAALGFDSYPRHMAEVMATHSQPTERLLVIGGGWGGDELTLAQRKGLSLWNAELLENPEKLSRLKALGYTKLVLISQSPQIYAVLRASPGQAALERLTYQSKFTPLVQSWPVVYRDDDIYIAELP